jgi:hypothetical protein
LYNSNTPSILNTPSSHNNNSNLNVNNRTFNQINNSDLNPNDISSNILLTPVNHHNTNTSSAHNLNTTTNTIGTGLGATTPYNSQYTKIRDDFTDAQLLIKRDVQGKHNIATILLQNNTKIEATSPSSQTNLNKSLSNLNLLSPTEQTASTQPPLQSDHSTTSSTTYEMNTFKNSSFLSSLKSQKGSQGSSSGLMSINAANSPFASKLIGKSQCSPSPPSSSHNQSVLVKGESLLKNKMKKFMNRIPTSHSSNALFQQTITPTPTNTSTLPSSPLTSRKSNTKKPQAPLSQFQNTTTTTTTNNNNGHTLPIPPPLPEKSFSAEKAMHQEHATQNLPKTGLLKFNRTNESASNLCKTREENTGSSPTSEMSNLNEQKCYYSYSSSVTSSSDFLENTPVYTETKLPPRILKKYQKQRAMTEAIVKSDDEENVDIGMNFYSF